MSCLLVSTPHQLINLPPGNNGGWGCLLVSYSSLTDTSTARQQREVRCLLVSHPSSTDTTSSKQEREVSCLLVSHPSSTDTTSSKQEREVSCLQVSHPSSTDTTSSKQEREVSCLQVSHPSSTDTTSSKQEREVFTCDTRSIKRDNYSEVTKRENEMVRALPRPAVYVSEIAKEICSSDSNRGLAPCQTRQLLPGSEKESCTVLVKRNIKPKR